MIEPKQAQWWERCWGWWWIMWLWVCVLYHILIYVEHFFMLSVCSRTRRAVLRWVRELWAGNRKERSHHGFIQTIQSLVWGGGGLPGLIWERQECPWKSVRTWGEQQTEESRTHLNSVLWPRDTSEWFNQVLKDETLMFGLNKTDPNQQHHEV